MRLEIKSSFTIHFQVHSNIQVAVTPREMKRIVLIVVVVVVIVVVVVVVVVGIIGICIV